MEKRARLLSSQPQPWLPCSQASSPGPRHEGRRLLQPSPRSRRLVVPSIPSFLACKLFRLPQKTPWSQSEPAGEWRNQGKLRVVCTPPGSRWDGEVNPPSRALEEAVPALDSGPEEQGERGHCELSKRQTGFVPVPVANTGVPPGQKLCCRKNFPEGWFCARKTRFGVGRLQLTLEVGRLAGAELPWAMKTQCSGP